MAVLTNGYNVQLNQVTNNGTPKPLYPITRAKDVILADGDVLETVIGDIEGALDDIETNYVEKAWLGVNSNAEAGVTGVATLDENGQLVDGQLKTATSSVKGGVKITDTFKADASGDASDVAASEILVRSVKTIADNATPQSWLGVASNSTSGVTGVATLDTDGKVPSSQLPSYVDDVIEVAAVGTNVETGVVETLYYDVEKTQPVTPESGKIYINTNTNITYRWGGTVYAVVATDLALGETASTAYRGDRGKIAYDHAMNLLPNGDPATNTNPHGTTKTDVGLGNVDDISQEGLKANIMTDDNIIDALGYTPLDTNAYVDVNGNDGIVTSADYQSFKNMQEIIISTNSQSHTFASGNGIWVEVVSDDANP